MLKTKTDNPNYLAKIVKMPELREHPNADRLALATVDGQVVVTSKDSKVGGLYVFFPLECKINSEFLSYINGYSSADKNRDKGSKGYFDDKGRVRATRLRGVASEGYLHPVESVNDWLQSLSINFVITEDHVGTEFDSFGENLFVEKYVVRKRISQEVGRGTGKIKRESRLVENQFRLHPDSKHLKRQVLEISPEDWIDVSAKFHGANFVAGKVLTKRKLNLLERFVRRLGVKVDESEYGLVYSSRRVIKNEYADAQSNHFYGVDIWGILAKKYEEAIQNGITLYGEAVGFTPTGAGIQGNYDYGCERGESELFVFRITYTSPDGRVYEFSAPEVIHYCEFFGLKHTPFHYIGKAKDMYRDIDPKSRDWHKLFLERLIEDFLEKDCDAYCNTKGLPDEGVVVSKRVGAFSGYKLKSLRFLARETELLDKGESNIEDEA